MMPFYFLDESGNYYESLTDKPAPDGHTEVPQRPAPHWDWDGAQWVEGSLPAITSDQVNAERDRRIAQGISVTTSVAGTFPVQTRSRDLFNITGLVTLAQQRITDVDTDPITFRDANNTDRTLLPSEMIELGKQAAALVDAHYKAAWVLKDTDPIPQDYATNETYWP